MDKAISIKIKRPLRISKRPLIRVRLCLDFSAVFIVHEEGHDPADIIVGDVDIIFLH